MFFSAEVIRRTLLSRFKQPLPEILRGYLSALKTQIPITDPSLGRVYWVGQPG